jgi:hypothetical protein
MTDLKTLLVSRILAPRNTSPLNDVECTVVRKFQHSETGTNEIFVSKRVVCSQQPTVSDV